MRRGGDLLPDDVTKDAAFFRLVVPPGAVDLLGDEPGHDRQRDELRVGVLQRRTGGRAVILEHQDVAEPDIALQVDDPLAERPQHPLDLRLGHRRQDLAVIGRLDDHFVRADPVHAIEEPLAFAIQIALDLQRRILVRHGTQVPAGSIRRAAVVAEREHFVRGQGLAARTERAVLRADDRGALEPEVVGPLAAVRGNDHPAAGDRVFAKFRQCEVRGRKRLLDASRHIKCVLVHLDPPRH